MTVNFDTIELKVTVSECIDLKYCLVEQLKQTIKSHWVNYPGEWQKHEAQRLSMIRELCRVTNYTYTDDLKMLELYLDTCVREKVKP